MKYVFFTLALLTLTTSCELRSTNFDPDEQHVYADEVTQIASWDQFQAEELTTEEFESEYAEKYVDVEYDTRQTAKGIWVIEGSIKNFAGEAHFEGTEMIASFHGNSNQLLGKEKYTVQDHLAPGDVAGFYFKSDDYTTAQSVTLKINQVKTAE